MTNYISNTDLPDNIGRFSVKDFYFYNQEHLQYTKLFYNIQDQIIEYYSNSIINILSNDKYIICIYDNKYLTNLEYSILKEYVYGYYTDDYNKCCAYWNEDHYFCILYNIN
jgi:hypothetical protein